MNARSIGYAIVRGGLTAAQYGVFFVLMFLRPFVRVILKGYMALTALFFVVAFFLKPPYPMEGYVVLGALWFVAALLSWKYDVLLQRLSPDGRTLYFDV